MTASSGYIEPSYTFDNVKGKFPIGFFIWNTQIELPFKDIHAQVYMTLGNSFKAGTTVEK
jgi:hypothetical protein